MAYPIRRDSQTRAAIPRRGTGHPSAASPSVPSPGELEQRYLGLMQLTGQAVLIVCAGLIVFANEVAHELLAVTPACDLRGLRFIDFIAPDRRIAIRARLGALAAGGQFTTLVGRDLLRHGLKPTQVEMALQGCAYLGQPAVQVLMRDLSEQARLQEEVVHLARFDALTDLSNRTHFLDLLDAAIARAERDGAALAIVRVSLDNFRAVNDAAGLAGGDFVLNQVADRLRHTSNPGAPLARLSGDQFGLVLEGPEPAEVAASRLMETLADGFRFEGTDYHAKVSIGIALFPLHARRRDRLLSKSMLAMKFAKAHGGNGFQVYSEGLDELDRVDVQRRAQALLRLCTLTRREREVMDLLVTGKTSRMIGYLLGISVRTIAIHRSRVMGKMQADSVADLVHMTLELHALPLADADVRAGSAKPQH
jgi:diguanylate cyclase (GGDEF)-like protein